jgi:hypothetical protein
MRRRCFSPLHQQYNDDIQLPSNICGLLTAINDKIDVPVVLNCLKIIKLLIKKFLSHVLRTVHHSMFVYNKHLELLYTMYSSLSMEQLA